MKSRYGIVLLLLLTVLTCAGIVSGPGTHEYMRSVVKTASVQKAYFEGRLAFIDGVSRESNPYWQSDRDRATEWALGWKEQRFCRIPAFLAIEIPKAWR
ncbi:MAG: hypothetical protein GY878_06965 [Fuerstiella sp.]|nr:hypothetical protein [Fuerstiella sp.]